MGWLKIVMCLGFALEALGLALAATGFLRTWRANAAGRPFFSPRFQRLFAWVQVHVLRRQPRTYEVSGRGEGRFGFEGTAVGFAPRALTADMTLEEQLQVVQTNAVRALQEASAARSDVTKEARKWRRAVADVERRMDSTHDSLTAYAKGLVVDGVPRAIAGLFFAAAGLVLQGVASIAAF